MATEQKQKNKWKRDVSYISHAVSDISQKMDHIVKELRDASFSLEHLADTYGLSGKPKKYLGLSEEYYTDY